MVEPTKLLLVDDDADVLDALSFIFADAGYAVATAASHEEALACVAADTFDFILTDLFGAGADGLRLAGALRAAAHPTPVGITSSRRVTRDAVTGAGFVCFIAKPFGVDDVLSAVATCLDTDPLTEEQRRQAATLRAFLSRLGDGDWDGAAALCTDDVLYAPPGWLAADALGGGQGVIEGRACYRGYVELAARRYPGFRADDVRVVPMPHGLAARYTARWRGPGGGEVALSAGMVCEFDADALLRGIGVRVSGERLRALRAAS